MNAEITISQWVEVLAQIKDLEAEVKTLKQKVYFNQLNQENKLS